MLSSLDDIHRGPRDLLATSTGPEGDTIEFAAACRIDDDRIFVIPVALGAEAPLFHGPINAPLSSSCFPQILSGVILLTYQTT